VTTYQEGPFRRWQAVSFGGLEMLVRVIAAPIVPNTFLNYFSPGVLPGDTEEEKLAPFRKVWTGQESGAFIDATSMLTDWFGGSPDEGESRIIIFIDGDGNEAVSIQIADGTGFFGFIDLETAL